jgi:hypothetical protein
MYSYAKYVENCTPPPPPPPHARAPHLPFLSPRAHSLSVVKVFSLFRPSFSLQCALLHGVLKRAYIRLSLTATHCSLAPRTFQDLLRVGDGGGGGERAGAMPNLGALTCPVRRAHHTGGYPLY